MNRREFVKRAVVSAALLTTSVSAVYEILARYSSGEQQTIQTIQSSSASQTTQVGQSQSSSSSSQVQTPSGYVFITSVSALTGRSSAYFNHPTQGMSLLVSVSGQWKAFSATCTHQPCTVQYGGGSSIGCPCHGATFSRNNGAVLGGPAPRPLPEYGVEIDASGNLFVSDSAIS